MSLSGEQDRLQKRSLVTPLRLGLHRLRQQRAVVVLGRGSRAGNTLESSVNGQMHSRQSTILP
jgi:hypothetical protein